MKIVNTLLAAAIAFGVAGCGRGSEIEGKPLFEETETIYTAAAAGDAAAVQRLMEEEPWDHNVADYNGILPLCYAAKGGNVEIIWMMVNEGANVNMPDQNGKTPLQYAKDAGHDEAVQYLQELGATE